MLEQIKREIALHSFRHNVDRRLNYSGIYDPTFYLKYTGQEGGMMIGTWEVQQVLQRYASARKIHDPTINLAATYQDKQFRILRDLHQLVPPKNRKQVTRTFFGYHSGLLADALGVTLEPDFLQHIPQPLEMPLTALAHYNREEVITTGAEIRSRLQDHSRIVCITQGGSRPQKKFGKRDIQEIGNAIHDIDPRAKVIILSDYFRSNHGNTNQPHTDFTDVQTQETSFGTLVRSSDPNILSSYMYAADTIVASDSFYAWLGTGSRVMRPDRQGILQPNDAVILYTVADPTVWAIPGATIVESPSIAEYRNTGLPTHEGLINPDYYPITFENNGHRLHTRDIQLVKDQLALSLA